MKDFKKGLRDVRQKRNEEELKLRQGGAQNVNQTVD